MADELEFAKKDLEAFSRFVFDDLTARLRAIDGYSRMLEETLGVGLGEQGKHLLEVMRENSTKIGQRVDDLVAFSKAGRQPMSGQAVDMKTVMDGVWRDICTSSSDKRPKLTLHALPEAQGDLALLKQVCANFVSNAVKFSSKRSDPAIEIGARKDGSMVVYYVKDNGAGFDMRYADNLFNVFRRLHSESEFPGAGAGLAIVQRIVERHGGHAWAEGEVDRGATFFFSLPAPSPTHGDGI